MLGFICLLLGLSMLYWMAILPLYRHQARKVRSTRREALKMAKIQAVRNYYPGLEFMTPSEIKREYDVNRAYNNIASPW